MTDVSPIQVQDNSNFYPTAGAALVGAAGGGVAGYFTKPFLKDGQLSDKFIKKVEKAMDSSLKADMDKELNPAFELFDKSVKIAKKNVPASLSDEGILTYVKTVMYEHEKSVLQYRKKFLEDQLPCRNEAALIKVHEKYNIPYPAGGIKDIKLHRKTLRLWITDTDQEITNLNKLFKKVRGAQTLSKAGELLKKDYPEIVNNLIKKTPKQRLDYIKRQFIPQNMPARFLKRIREASTLEEFYSSLEFYKTDAKSAIFNALWNTKKGAFIEGKTENAKSVISTMKKTVSSMKMRAALMYGAIAAAAIGLGTYFITKNSSEEPKQKVDTKA